MCTSNIHLFQSKIYKSLVKLRRILNAGTLIIIPKRNRLEFLTFFRHFAFLSEKHTQTEFAILTTLESTTLDETIRCASKWFILTQNPQNLNLVISSV